MSPGAKLVWAVAFAEEMRNAINNPPSGVTQPGEENLIAWDWWEKDQAMHAAEFAYAVAKRFEEAEPRIFDGFGSIGDVTAMYLAVKGHE